MNLNKNLLYITKTCPKLSRVLVPYRFTRSNSFLSTTNKFKIFYQTLVKDVHFTRSRALPRQTSFYLYSSAVSENQVIKKHPDSFVTVPSLQFEDVEFEQPVSHSDLCDALQVCDSLEEQMITLTSTLALSPEDVEKRTKFCRVIESLLKPFFGDIKIQMFGSTVNGFGFKGCDIDMSFETFTKQKEEISYIETPDVPLVSEVMCGKITPKEMCLLPRREQLHFIHTVLLEFYKESAEPAIFINAHVPLVRFHHDKYNLKCDFSCRNKVAFANSKMLYLFGILDERVIPMMMTIRYWAKHVELIGKGLMFNTYTISLIVIHFLQTRNPPIIPSVEHIVSLSDSLEVDDMNDKTFLEIKKSILPSKNTQTLSELLRDFFFFYLYFDFTRVICPLIGGSVPREKFFSNLPSKKFKMNTICVQDPMLESHNVADLVDYKHCKKLVSELLAVCRILQDNSKFSPSSTKWGLLTLLDKSAEYYPHYLILPKNVCFTVPLFNKQILNKYGGENTNIMTAKTLLHLLQHILLFECRTVELPDVIKMLERHDEIARKQRRIQESVRNMVSEKQEMSRKLRKQSKIPVNFEKYSITENLLLEEFEKFNAEHELILCSECKIVKNTWLGRDFASVESLPLSFANDLVEKEHCISVQTAKQNELNAMDVKTKPFTILYECYLSTKAPEPSLLINFRPLQITNFNPVLGIFLKEYIPKLVKDLNEAC